MHSPSRRILVCFAVKEEARFFHPRSDGATAIKIMVSGMGWKNAEEAIQRALGDFHPDLVLSCGFAGGLDPNLRPGAILFAAEDPPLGDSCIALGAKRASFVCSPRVLSTAAEKRAWRERSKADAVEMESEIIRRHCQVCGVTSATIRVILDAAGHELPLDLETVLTAQKRISIPKLAAALIASPRRVKGLLALQRESKIAAKELGEFLDRLLAEIEKRS